jgi:isopentenyl-diphosphate delta-isomerase type 1
MNDSEKSWSADGLSQEDLMISDECILLDNDDSIIGHVNKKESHVFSAQQPRGQLHRAFSVFLFNSEGKMLLQQRAADKITFPSVWTNACCSHPLSGQTPSEADGPEAVADGSVPGVKAAAVRKLLHELGIEGSEVPIPKFKFLTRLHYWAADVVTHGVNSPWGEHEIDYILFIKADVTLNLNKEEVGDAKYVSLKELQSMMQKDSGMLWSPWFRIIVEKFLVHWWHDLDRTLTSNDFTDYKTIYRFDPSNEHMGGAGKAGSWLGVSNYEPPKSASSSAVVGDKNVKQGSYGKVKIHKHSKISQLSHLDEVFAALWFKYGAVMPNKVNTKDEDTLFCDAMLGKVSRSFASVIRQLPKGLCLDILIFYLALRALDTIEDDMEAFVGRESEKVEHLNNFYRTALVTEGWHMEGVGQGDEKTLLEQYFRCVSVFKGLSPESQEVIADITKRMGQVGTTL